MVIHCCQLSIVAMTSHLATVDTNFKKKSYSFVLVLVQMIAKDQSYKMTKHENHDGDDSHITIHLFLSSEILAIEIFLRPILPPRRSRLPVCLNSLTIDESPLAASWGLYMGALCQKPCRQRAIGDRQLPRVFLE